MPFDFGPEHIQLSGYTGSDACPYPRGGVLPPASAVDFYAATRQKGSSGALSYLSATLPIVAFMAALSLLATALGLRP